MTRCRSMLFVPGNRIADYLGKAVDCRPDILVLDAEDSVPEDQATIATRDIVQTLRADPFPKDMTVAVRVRRPAQIDIFQGAFDREPNFVLPKATHSSVLEACGYGGLWPIVETLKGVGEQFDFVSIPGVRGLIYGPMDLAAELGCFDTFLGQDDTLLAAKLNHRIAILGRPGTYAPEWDGVVCLSPRDVDVANVVYRPSSDAVDRAYEILSAEAKANGAPVKLPNGIVCGTPVYKQARAVLERARKYGMIP